VADLPDNLLEVVAGPDGFLVRLRVSPGARRAGIKGVHGGALKLAVCEPPEDGRANAGVVALLSALLKLPRKQIALVSGHASQDKRVLISGFKGSAADLAAALCGN
jgi:uncharacterized protein (TIGR00251 family)